MRTASGASRDAWNEAAKAWVKIEALAGREFSSSNQRIGESTHRFRAARWQDVKNVTELMRINWAGRLYDITAVLNVDERNTQAIILAKQQK